MQVDYDHQKNLHTENGPRAALPLIFGDWKPNSLLDVGCGLGTWLKAAVEFGIPDIFGIDGVDIPKDKLLISSDLFQQHNLTLPIDLGRRFDVALCLEVAEHLDEIFAKNIVKILTSHTDVVIFSAAPPWQTGQHHVNCQHPAYWQSLFNEAGFTCFDEVRWRIWNHSEIEPWYRQNIFIAKRNSSESGQEERIKAVVHPELLPVIEGDVKFKSYIERVKQIEDGAMPVEWYLRALVQGFKSKLARNSVGL